MFSKPSDVVNVREAYKRFTLPLAPPWKQVSRQYGKVSGKANLYEHLQVIVAVDHVSFTVHAGEIFGLVGPSGSGKSTLIRLLAGLLPPDGGELSIFGYDVVHQPLQVQRLINPVSVGASFFKQLSPVENLLYGARSHGLRGSEALRQVSEILARLGLEQSVIDRPMEAMSRGLQQIVALGRALLTRPRLLLLDEPTIGLDPSSKHQVQGVLRELRDKSGTTILLASRNVNDASALCDRIALIEGGKILAIDPPHRLEELSRNSQEPALEELFCELAVQKYVKPEVFE